MFWTFVLAADENNIVTPESIEAVQLRVNSAIELMHPDLAVPAVPESTEPPEELTDREDEMPSDDTPERAIGNNSDDDHAAGELEPSSEITHGVEPTPEAAEEIDLVDQIIEMMRHIFEAAKEHFESYLLN